MSAIVLNGTTYDGLPSSGSNPWPPSSIRKTRTKAGKTKIMASGLRVFIGPGTVRRGWVLSWEKVNDTTVAAVANLVALTTTFTFVDQRGTSQTVQCEADDQTEDTAFTSAAGTIYYALQLTIWQAT